MNILLYPDNWLRTKAKSVESITPWIQTVISEMMDKMDECGGLGLAATQCGIGLRIFVTHIPGQERMVFVNPELEDLKEGIATMTEGCLSLPDALVEVSRPSSVRLRALDFRGCPVDIFCRGIMSACVQHENDHLDGILILDKTDPVEKRLALQNVWAAEHPRHYPPSPETT